MREICFDTETTGLHPEEGDRIIEIGCVELIDKKITGKIFQTYINPQKSLSLDIVNLTKITDDILKDKPLFSDIYKDFLKFIGNDLLIAHNIKFDISFINNELQLIGLPKLSNQCIDTMDLAKKKLNRHNKIKLDDLCKEFKINKTEREEKGHGALLDSKLLAEVYLKLIDTQLMFNDNLFEKKEEEIFKKDNINIKNRHFTLTDEDLKLHEEFIKNNIKNSLWYK